MQVLIIGGQGMLGRPVVRRLLEDGFDVTVMARRPEKARGALPKNARVVPGDLNVVSTIDQALDGCDAAYLSVDSTPVEKFHPETDGLKNLIAAMGNHPKIRLVVLSALGQSNPGAETHPWWHVREKFQAQQLAVRSGLPWTILEPAWFMESIPLFIRGKNFTDIWGRTLNSFWIAGDDMGRALSRALSENLGVEERIPLQGPERLTLGEAGRRFIALYDPEVRVHKLPFWMLRFAGLFAWQARELANLFDVYKNFQEPPPDPSVWETYGKPALTVERYAEYVKKTGDFPQK